MISIVLGLALSGALPAEHVSAERPGHCERPRWSRDGKHLAYRRWQDQTMELDVLWELKREERVLPEGAEPPSIEGAPAAGGDVWDELSAPAAEGAAPAQACRHLTWGPALQPDAFVFTCNAERGYRLYAQGGQTLPVDADAAEPAFNPARDEIAYVSPEGIARLACRRLGRSCGWARGRPESLVSGAGAEWVHPVWANEGRLVVERHEGTRSGDLWLVDPALPSEKRALRLTDTEGKDRAAAVAPDGTRVAWFVRGQKAKRRGSQARGHEIRVMRLEPGAPSVVVATDALLSEDGPAWTPDGKGIIYVRDQTGASDPLMHVRVPGETDSERKRLRPTKLRAPTLANRDPRVAATPKGWRVAVSAMGREGDDLKRSWRKIYVLELDPETL